MWHDNLIDVGNTFPQVEHDLQSVLLVTSVCEAFWVMLMSSSGLTSFLIVASMPLLLLTIGWIGTVETTEQEKFYSPEIVNSNDEEMCRLMIPSVK